MSTAVKTENGRGLRDDWSQLTGRTVEVWREGRHVVTGTVEQAAPDDSVLLIAGNGNTTRKLYDKRSGYEAWA